MFNVKDVVVFKSAGLKKFVYDYEELPFSGAKQPILPAKEVIDLSPGQEDWDSISRSAEPMYIDAIRPPRPGFSYEEDAWVTVMGINGVYGSTPNDLKRVPNGIETWCGTNQ
jgi:hypothetical protein